MAAILKILGGWVLGGGVLLQQFQNLDFRNPRPRISLHTKSQLSTIILKEFEKFLGVRVLGGGMLLQQFQNLNFQSRQPRINR